MARLKSVGFDWCTVVIGGSMLEFFPRLFSRIAGGRSRDADGAGKPSIAQNDSAQADGLTVRSATYSSAKPGAERIRFSRTEQIGSCPIWLTLTTDTAPDCENAETAHRRGIQPGKTKRLLTIKVLLCSDVCTQDQTALITNLFLRVAPGKSPIRRAVEMKRRIHVGFFPGRPVAAA